MATTSLGPEATNASSLRESWRAPVLWGIGVGTFQAVSPAAFWWVNPDVVWSVSLAIIAAVYIGFAVADGRRRIVVTEIGVTASFVIVALFAVTTSPWLVVVGLLGHGAKDLWQHRTRFVANTRWWPPFCFVVDVVAAGLIALLLVSGVDFK